MRPAGAVEVFDLTVAEASHYVTWGGFIAQNCGFDELTQFSETQYLYLFSRLRRPKGMAVPLRMRGATNPGGPGHHWVKRRFIANAREVEPDHLLSPPSKEALEAAALTGRAAEGAHFVRSKAHDNPGLDVAAYQMQLARLDVVTRARLRNGDWDVAESGNVFKPEWWRFLPARPERGVRWVRYWDLAATEPHQGNPDPDWTAGVLLGLEHTTAQKPGEPTEGGRIIIADVVRARLNPGDVQQLVQATAKKDGRLVPVRVEEEPGSAGKANTSAFVRLLKGFDVAGHRKTGDKPSFWRPLAAQAQVGNLYLVEAPWNADFMEELQALPNGPHDDMADAAGGALAQVVEGSDAARLRMLLGK